MNRVPCTLIATALALLSTGCAHYEALSLPTAAASPTDPARVTVDTAKLPLQTMRSVVFDPSDGLDIDEVAMLAVADNPELLAGRADAGVSRAQAFAAGMLPDPQLTLGRERQLGGAPDTSIGFNAGLSFDVGSLISRPTARRAASDELRKTDLGLLWQELQVIAQARTLFIRRTTQERLAAALAGARARFQDRLDRTRIAASRGLLANDAVTPHLVALQDVLRQTNDLERQQNQTRHDLNTLLGLAPEVRLVLVGSTDFAPVDDTVAMAAVPDLPARRPDLLALKAGYDAQDDRYRGALLAQFPAVTIGPTRTRDTAYVNTSGLSVGLTLPIFNRNRGNIAIEKATRGRLRVDYQARLDASVADIARLLDEQHIVDRQLQDIAPALVELQGVADRAEVAFTARNVDALVLTNAQTALLAKQVEQITLQEAVQDQRVALQTLLAADIAPDRIPVRQEAR